MQSANTSANTNTSIDAFIFHDFIHDKSELGKRRPAGMWRSRGQES